MRTSQMKIAQMKIAQVTKYFYPHHGGIESHVLGISQKLIEKGAEILVFTSNIPKTKKREEYKGIKIHRSTKFFTLSRDPFTPGIFLDLLKEDYDLIHVHLPDPFNSVFAFLASLIKRKPLIVTYHADIIREKWHYRILNSIYELFLHLILRHSQKILATTPNYVEESRILSKYKDKIEIVPNFVDTERFNSKVNGNKIRQKHNLKNKKIILFLGRLVPYKGLEYLLRAYSQIKKEDSVLIIAGDGPLKDELKKTAKDVIFTNITQDEIPQYYAACDFFVLPSITRQEAFGISLLEAMASGKLCITTNISGMPYVVGDTGILVEPKNTEELAKAIQKLLSDPDKTKELGKKARKRVENKFTLEKVTHSLYSIYRDLKINS